MLLGIACFIVSGYLLFVASVVWDAVEEHEYKGLWKDALVAPYIVIEDLLVEWDAAKTEIAGQEFLSYRDYLAMYLPK